MSDQLGSLFEDLRARTLSEVVAPGTPHIRATVRRRRHVAVMAGSGVAVAAVLVGVGVGLRPGNDGDHDVGSPGRAPSSAGPTVIPEPSVQVYGTDQTAGDLLAVTPTSINSTAGVVTSSYEDDLNDMPADIYTVHFFCVGAGKVDVRVKQGESGNRLLGHGTAICKAHDPSPLRLTIRQPAHGYLRISAAGDAQSNDRAGFAFEFLSATGKTTPGPSGPAYQLSPSA